MAKADDPTIFSLILAGDTGVGKSCILQRFVDDSYNSFIIHQTIGCDFKRIDIQLGDTRIRLRICDLSGRESDLSKYGSYLSTTHGVLLVYDITMRHTFHAIPHWIRSITMPATCSYDFRRVLL